VTGTLNEPQRQLAAALGRVASGLFVLTARRGEAETGMLASWVQQCSFEPPLVSVAVARGREIAACLTAGALFTLNILDDTQTDMIVHFGRGFAAGEPAFTGLEVERGEGGPVLADALACLECRVASRCPTGDHELIVGEVLRGRLLGEGHPMVHIRKSGMHY
jgi:flavin reductase (DIM6/NTAB) family NADH-FMN oxidoreductase RutF